MFLVRNKWDWDEEDFKKVRRMCHELLLQNGEFIERDKHNSVTMQLILT